MLAEPSKLTCRRFKGESYQASVLPLCLRLPSPRVLFGGAPWWGRRAVSCGEELGVGISPLTSLPDLLPKASTGTVEAHGACAVKNCPPFMAKSESQPKATFCPVSCSAEEPAR